MSQNARILAHLQRRPITAMQALDQYGCFRLAARINDLRSMGHTILTETVKRNNKRYAQYRLVKAKEKKTNE